MDQARHIWPDMVRMRAWLEEDEAYGPPQSRLQHHSRCEIVQE